MKNDMDPLVGNWYQHVEKGLDFEVVAVDNEAATVEIQYLDGTLEEIELEDWYELDLEPAEPPADWTGPLDDPDSEDIVDAEPELEEDDWDEPAPKLPREIGRRTDLDDDLSPDDLGDTEWD